MSDIINKLKRDIVVVAHRAGSGHIPSAFSILDIIWTLYNDVMLSDDRFILSKGHGCLALYAVLEEKGIIPKGSLDTFAHGGILGGHPDRNKIPGVLASTGSLGHGLPIAVGIAMAKKIKKEMGRVFVLVGDGELNEGSCWESLLLADQHNLSNLTIIVDYNHSTDRAVDLCDLGKKFAAFGFSHYQITPTIPLAGEPSVLLFALGNALSFDYPIAIIINTIKGDGCKRMQNSSWHHRAPNDQELKEILEELQ